MGSTVLFISRSTAAPSTLMATSAEPKLPPNTVSPSANNTGEANHSAMLNTTIPNTAQHMVVRITARVPKRFTSHAEQRMPLMEPIDRPNSTMPISAVETDKISRMAGVRVAQEAISRPGIKKNINSAHMRSCRVLRGEVNVIGVAPEVQQ